MNLLELVIQRKNNATWPIVAVLTRTGDFLPVRSEGVLELDLDALRACSSPLDYGRLLGHALFRDDLRDAFSRALAVARASQETLRLLLTVEDLEMRGLHWERLCAPIDSRWDFLSLDQDVSFSLYLPSLADQRFPPIGRRDLRALILVAAPSDLSNNYGLAEFDVAATVEAVKNSMGKIPYDVLASVDGAVGKPTLDNLCERITSQSYTLLHIVCHGKYDPNSGESLLALPGDEGRAVKGTQFIERLGRVRGAHGLPHFTFLMACESGNPSAENGFGGMGQRLVRELGMPAVLAMTAPVSVGTANKLASVFYQNLYQHGEPDRALCQSLAGLMGNSDVTVPAVFSRLGGRALFSEALDRPLTPAEIGHGLDCLKQLTTERAPVLGPQIDALAAKLRAFPDVTALAPEAAKEREQALADANQFAMEICEVTFHALAFDEPIPAYDPRCPFRGLAAFRREDKDFFFGRDVLVKTLVKRLGDYPFLIVSGASGSGKSSLVQAGLIPALAIDELAYMTPSTDPMLRLETALAKLPKDTLLLVDQFEELFTLCASDSERTKFVDALDKLSKERRVVITMRADFFDECAGYPQLKQLVQTRTELVAPMDATELRRAIEQQAASAGLRFEADLAEAILDDVQSEPGAMPLLQHALLLLWERRHGRWLRAAEYRSIGGVKEAISHTADEIFTTLPEADRERMRAIFLRLTRLGEDTTPGVERRDTRRRVPLQEIVPAGQDRQATVQLVNRLATARLVMTSVNPVSQQEEVEVAHEALIRYWPRLRGWLDEDRVILRLGNGVRDAALEWEQAKRDASLLVHHGARLEEALGLEKSGHYGFNQLESDYLHACKEQEEKARLEKERQQQARARLQRTLLIGSIVAAVVMMFLGIFGLVQAGIAEAATKDALSQKATADQAKQEADAQARRAQIGQISALSQAFQNRRFDLSLLLGVAAYQQSDELQTRGSLLSAVEQNPSILFFLNGHTESINGLAFSPNGKTLASSSEDGTIRLWNLETGQPIGQPLTGHTGAVNGIAFSPDGMTLASAGADKTIRLWNAETGEAIGQPLTGHTASVNGVRFSADGQTLVSVGRDNNIITWEVASQQMIGQPFNFGADEVNILALSPDGKILATSNYTDITLWDVAGQQMIGQPLTGHTRYVNALAFSQDGAMLASGSDDRSIRLWNVTTGEPIDQPLYGHYGAVNTLNFSPDGNTLASSGSDGITVLWDLASRQIKELPWNNTSVVITFSPDSSILAASNFTGQISLWDLAGRQTFNRTLSGHTDQVYSVAYSPDGKTLASGSNDKTIRLWNGETGEAIGQPLNGHTDTVYSVAFSPDGQTLASGSWDSTIILWDVASQQMIGQPLTGHQSGVYSIAFSPDGKILASASADKTIILWDVASHQPIGQPLTGHTDIVFGLAFSPDGKTMASAGGDNNIILWDVASQKMIGQPLTGHTAWVRKVTFSPDGATLASASSDSTVRLWDVASQKEIGQPLTGHRDAATSVAFSPDGKTLASGAWDTNIILWDVASHQPIGQPLTGHGDVIYSLAYSPDGKTLASASFDNTLRLWSIDPAAWRQRACQVANRDLTQDEWKLYMGDLPYSATCSGK
jgi:WD40 repeat protein